MKKIAGEMARYQLGHFFHGKKIRKLIAKSDKKFEAKITCS